MDASVLESMEARIASLERRVKGDLTDHDQSVVERLTIIDKKINSAIRGKRFELMTLLDTNRAIFQFRISGEQRCRRETGTLRFLSLMFPDEDNLGILKRTDALRALLDPTLEHNVGVDSCTKLALVEANMDRIEEARQMLEQMESSRKVLESAHIKSKY